jgi:hypothetical protein
MIDIYRLLERRCSRDRACRAMFRQSLPFRKPVRLAGPSRRRAIPVHSGKESCHHF